MLCSTYPNFPWTENVDPQNCFNITHDCKLFPLYLEKSIDAQVISTNLLDNFSPAHEVEAYQIEPLEFSWPTSYKLIQLSTVGTTK